MLVQINALIDQRRKLREHFSSEAEIGPSDVAVTSVDEKFLKKAIEIIEENIGDSDFDVEAMTEQMGMSRMQLAEDEGAYQPDTK